MKFGRTPFLENLHKANNYDDQYVLEVWQSTYDGSAGITTL